MCHLHLHLFILPFPSLIFLLHRTMAAPEKEQWADLVEPDFHQVNLEIEDYLKFTRGYKLDSGKSDGIPLDVPC